MTSTDFVDGQPSGGSAQTLKDAVYEVGQASMSRAGEGVSSLKDKGADKVNRATDTAGASLEQVARQLRQAADGLGEEQAWAGKAFQQGADGIERFAGYLSNGKFDDFARDLQKLAQSNPAAFLAGSVALGFLATRVVRATAEQAVTEQAAPDPTFEASVQPPQPYEEPRSFASEDDGYASPGVI